MRYIQWHRSGGDKLNANLSILAGDPGAGGAAHDFELSYAGGSVHLHFQEGGVEEAGPNGISNEALIAIVIDRLQGFQQGQFPHPANDIAAQFLEKALDALNARSRERIARGVEGKSVQ